MAVIVNGDGILTGISSLATSLTDITSGRGTVTGVATVGTLQLGAGVSISSPRSQTAAIFTNNTEFLTVDDAGRVGVGTITPNSDAHPENEKKINVGFITAKSVAGDIDARNVVIAGVSTIVGNVSMGGGNLTFGDSSSGNDDRLQFGASTDLEIFHNGSNNHIDCHTAGQELYIRPTKDVYFQDYVSDDVLVKMIKDGAVELYHDGTKKFETSGGGGTLTGDFTVTGNIYGGNHITIQDSDGSSDMLKIGASEDIRIYHYNNNSYIRQHTDLPLIIGGTSTGQSLYLNPKDGENSAIFKPNAEVELYYNNALKLETLNTGVEVFGSLIAEDDGAGSGTSEIQLQPYGTDGYINCTASGNLYTRMGSGYAIRTQIDSSGNFIVQSGNLKLATAGKGIDFSATSDSSVTTSELLDDYEEGKFTPGLEPSGGSFTSMPYSERHGFYVKIGRNVQVWIRLRVAGSGVDTSGASGYLHLTGLPYTIASTSAPDTSAEGGTFVINYYSNLQNLSDRVPTGYSKANTNYILMMTVGEGGSSPAMNVNAFNANNAQVYGFMSYFTA